MKKYDGIKLDDLDPSQIARETAENGVVVIVNSGASPEEYAEWNMGYGYHLSPDIWCTDKEHSDIFWRVSTEVVDGENKGLFADYELDWHTNVTPVADAEECVTIYGKTITYHTETWFCDSTQYWNTLDKETQDYYESLTIVLDPLRRLGRIKDAWQPNFREIYGERVINDIVKNRNSRSIEKARNMEPENKDIWKPSRNIIEKHRFVPNHPLGVKGLFFSPYEVHGWEKDGVPLSQEENEALFYKLYEELVKSDKYTYKHVWHPGDIVMMDQLITIHRRTDLQKGKPRELLRTASWYKKEVRNHTDYPL